MSGLGVYTVFYRCRRCADTMCDHDDAVSDSALDALKMVDPVRTHWCEVDGREAWGVLEPYMVKLMGAAT